MDRKLRYLLFGGHGEALQPARHVTQALLEGRHKVSLQTHSPLKFPMVASKRVEFPIKSTKTHHSKEIKGHFLYIRKFTSVEC